jgi:hypothetical protein
MIFDLNRRFQPVGKKIKRNKHRKSRPEKKKQHLSQDKYFLPPLPIQTKKAAGKGYKKSNKSG